MPLVDPGEVELRARLLARLAADPELERAAAGLLGCLRGGGKVLACGNGGSATQASHFAAELVNRFAFDRPGLPALALACDPAVLTSVANDDDFRSVFARQVEALGRPGDLLLVLTTSGRSANVLAALQAARRRGLATIALGGEERRALEAAGADVVVTVAGGDTPAVQEMHLFALHVLARAAEQGLFGGKP